MKKSKVAESLETVHTHTHTHTHTQYFYQIGRKYRELYSKEIAYIIVHKKIQMDYQERDGPSFLYQAN